MNCSLHTYCVESALYVFKDDIWDEFGAALYESYHNDHYSVNSGYNLASHHLCEDIETAIYNAEIAEEHYNY
jgi:hypothetical protein